VLCAIANVSLAADVNLSWDASTSANVGGYKIYYGKQSKTYTSAVDAGNGTSYKVTGLDDGVEYFFAVKSYSKDRTIESAGYSNEVSTKTAGTVPIIPPPVISPLTLTKIGNLVTSSANNTLPVGAVCNTYTQVSPSDAGKEALMAYREKDLSTVNGSCAIDASKYFAKGTKGYLGITYSYKGQESFLSNVLLIDMTVTDPVPMPSYILDTTLPAPKNPYITVDGLRGIVWLQSSFVPTGSHTDCLVSVNGSAPKLIKLLSLGRTQAYCKFEIPNTGANKVIFSFVAPGTPPKKGADVIYNYKLKSCN
jgi:hypothetical protein